MRIQRFMREGMSEEEARAEAGRRFGDQGSLREECERIDDSMTRNSRRGERLGSLRQDLRFAGRQLSRSPVVTLAVMLVLGRHRRRRDDLLLLMPSSSGCPRSGLLELVSLPAPVSPDVALPA
jgi:hypothetical protein